MPIFKCTVWWHYVHPYVVPPSAPFSSSTFSSPSPERKPLAVKQSLPLPLQAITPLLPDGFTYSILNRLTYAYSCQRNGYMPSCVRLLSFHNIMLSGSATLSHAPQSHSLSWVKNKPRFGPSTFGFSVLLLMDIWVPHTFWLLGTALL